MSKISKEEIKKLAKTLFFELNEEQVNSISLKSEMLLTSIESFLKLPIEGLEPLYYPINVSSHSLREDVPIKNSNPEDTLQNTKNKINKYVVVK